MKTTSVALRVLPKFFDVLRVFVILGFIAAVLSLPFNFFRSGYVEFKAPIYVAKQAIIAGVSAKNTDVKNINITTIVPTLKASLKVNFLIVIATCLYIASLCLTLYLQFKNLRDFFRSIKIGDPFNPKNVDRLRIISVTFLAISIIQIIKQFVTNLFLANVLNNVHFSSLYWTAAIPGFIWAVVIYVVADVFKYGFTLKKENEEFI